MIVGVRWLAGLVRVSLTRDGDSTHAEGVQVGLDAGRQAARLRSGQPVRVAAPAALTRRTSRPMRRTALASRPASVG
jgi:hypothetical protein